MVRRYSDLTKAELVALTPEQIQFYTDLEIAFEGIIPVSAPDLQIVPEVNIEKAHKVFECRGVNFVNESDALLFASMPKLKEAYGNNYSYKYLEPYEDYDKSAVAPTLYYAKEDVQKIAVLLKDITQIKTQNETAQKEYDKYLKSISSIQASVTGAIREAKKELREIQEAINVFHKHIDLAGGDKEIASNFFRAAYKDYATEWVNNILEV